MIAEIIMSLVLTGISLVIFAETGTYPEFGALSVIPPSFVPNILAYFFLACSAFYFIKNFILAFVKKTNKEGESYIQIEKDKWADSKVFIVEHKKPIINLSIIVAMAILYALLLDVVGYEILTAIFLSVSMFVLGERRWYILLIVPIAAIIVIYFGFVMGLRVQIPRLIY